MSSISKPRPQNPEERLTFLNEEANRLEAQIKENESAIESLEIARNKDTSDFMSATGVKRDELEKLRKEVKAEQAQKDLLISDNKILLEQANEVGQTIDEQTRQIKENETLLAEQTVQRTQRLSDIKIQKVQLETEQAEFAKQSLKLKEKEAEVNSKERRTDLRQNELDERETRMISNEAIIDKKLIDLKQKQALLDGRTDEVVKDTSDIDKALKTAKLREERAMEVERIAREKLDLAISQENRIILAEGAFALRDADLKKREKDFIFKTEELETRNKLLDLRMKQLKVERLEV